MGKQLVRKIGKSLKEQDACEDLAMKFEQPMDVVSIPVNEQKEDPSTCGVLHRHRYEVNPDMVERQEKAGLSLAANDETDKHMEVTEDSVKSENSMKSNLKNLRCNCFINMTISCIFLQPIIFNIRSVFLDKATRISFTSTNYAAPCPRSFNESTKFIEINSEKKGNFITEEAVKTEEAFVNMIIIGCILLLQIISFSSDMAAKFFTNDSSSSRSLDAKSCSSSTDGQTKSNVSLTTFSPGTVQQVFVNFRGEELRYNFVSHLTDAFQRHGIRFFIDKDEQRGKELENLFLRIEESRIALAIFSTRYPESSWCMDELVKMKKLADQGKLRVIPIFYKVKEGDVGKQKGEFGEYFWNKAKASSGDEIKEWKEALESISNKIGLSLEEKRYEAEFIKEIVEEVQRVIEAIGLEEKYNHCGKCQEIF